MPKSLVIAKIVAVMIGAQVIGYSEGVGAYYAPGLMEGVCRYRVSEGWNDLDCDWPCLVSAIEPEHLGEMWLVDLPGGSVHVCHVVDVGAAHDLNALRSRGEVIEISWAMAQAMDWTGYTEGVKVWRLGTF